MKANVGAIPALPLLAAVVLIGGIALFAFDPFGLDFSQETMANWLRGLGPVGGSGVIALMVVHSLVPFPAELVVFVAGMLYGTAMGALYSWLGAMLGAALAFGIARRLGRETVLRLVPDTAHQRLERWSKSAGVETLLAARLIPLVSFNVLNYGAGLTTVGWGTFLWTTAVGIVPTTLLTAFCGAHARSISWQDWGIIATGALVLLTGVHVWRQR